MVTTAALSLLAFSLTEEIRVEDYFPLTPGTKWVYEQKTRGSDRVTLVTDTVLEVEKIGFPDKKDEDGDVVETFPKIEGIPIRSAVTGQGIDTVYHQVKDNQVIVVATDANAPLEKPYVIIKAEEKGVKWNHVGTTGFAGDVVDFHFRAEMKTVRARKVLDERVDVIEVKMEAIVEGTANLPFKTTQYAWYGKGIGLIESKTITDVNGKKFESTRKLISYSLGSPD